MAELKQQYDEKLAQKEELKRKAEYTELMLERATKLMSGLAGEKERWQETVKVMPLVVCLPLSNILSTILSTTPTLSTILSTIVYDSFYHCLPSCLPFSLCLPLSTTLSTGGSSTIIYRFHQCID